MAVAEPNLLRQSLRPIQGSVRGTCSPLDPDGVLAPRVRVRVRAAPVEICGCTADVDCAECDDNEEEEQQEEHSQQYGAVAGEAAAGGGG